MSGRKRTSERRASSVGGRPHILRIFAGQQGSSIVQMLILLPLFVFLVFYGIEISTVLVRYQILAHGAYRLLDQAAAAGEITSGQLATLSATIQQAGMDPAALRIGSTTSPIGVPIPKGQLIQVAVGYPRGAVTVGRLIGLPSWDASALMWVRGSAVSEKVGP